MLRWLSVPLALMVAAPAWAQVSASVRAWSDYRYRGASLSDGKPALQLHAGYDAAGGGYAGAMLSSVRVGESGKAELMALAYAGWTLPLRGAWHADAGAQYVAFTQSHEYDYAELYAGLSTRKASLRLHYAADYFGGGSAWYAEYDIRHALSERWTVIAHAGLLRSDGISSRRDGFAGVSWARGGYEVLCLWDTASGGPRTHAQYYTAHYSAPGYDDDTGVVLRLTRSW